MPYKRSSSPSSPETRPKKKARPPKSASSSPKGSAAWTPEEDAIIVRMRATTPASSWAAIATALGPDRSPTGARLHFSRVLKFGDLTGNNALNDEERTALEKAYDDLESGREKWWFVAKRYEELGKGQEVRELGKLGVKKWYEALQKEKSARKGEEEAGRTSVTMLDLEDDDDEGYLVEEIVR